MPPIRRAAETAIVPRNFAGFSSGAQEKKKHVISVSSKFLEPTKNTLNRFLNKQARHNGRNNNRNSAIKGTEINNFRPANLRMRTLCFECRDN